MYTAIFDIFAAAAVIIGTFFSVVGVLGFIRMPDVYTRLHATGKVGVFGVVFLLIAAVIHTPLGWGKGLFLIFFLLVTGAVTAHAIASAAYRIQIPMKGAEGNDRGDKQNPLPPGK
jgi:multicomponent Na+:H+ antiporter subunit G